MEVTAISPQTLAVNNPTPEEEAQFAAEFANMVALTVGPLMASALMRQAGFAKQVLNDALSDK